MIQMPFRLSITACKKRNCRGLQSSRFDFTLITMHSIFGDTKAERRAEVMILDDVYQVVQEADPAEQDVILLGDFNLPQEAHGFAVSTPSTSQSSAMTTERPRWGCRIIDRYGQGSGTDGPTTTHRRGRQRFLKPTGTGSKHQWIWGLHLLTVLRHR